MDKNMFVDSHCHLDRYLDIEEILQRATLAGVDTLLSICTTRENFAMVSSIAASHPKVYATAGIHPTDVHTIPQEEVYPWLLDCANHPKVVGFGETGLDTVKTDNLLLQESYFRAHIQASLETKLPLVVHMRGELSESRLKTILETYPHPPKGVLHCFTGSLDVAMYAISLGWKISISGIVTFSKALQETVKALPIESLLLETDAPWLAPHPYRGKQNEPAYLVKTAEMVSALQDVSLETLADHTTKSFYELFQRVPKRG